jgi:hypothetical protein
MSMHASARRRPLHLPRRPLLRALERFVEESAGGEAGHSDSFGAVPRTQPLTRHGYKPHTRTFV